MRLRDSSGRQGSGPLYEHYLCPAAKRRLQRCFVLGRTSLYIGLHDPEPAGPRIPTFHAACLSLMLGCLGWGNVSVRCSACGIIPSAIPVVRRRVCRHIACRPHSAAGGRKDVVMARSQAACPETRIRADGRVPAGRFAGKKTTASASSGEASGFQVQIARRGWMLVWRATSVAIISGFTTKPTS